MKLKSPREYVIEPMALERGATRSVGSVAYCSSRFQSFAHLRLRKIEIHLIKGNYKIYRYCCSFTYPPEVVKSNRMSSLVTRINFCLILIAFFLKNDAIAQSNTRGEEVFRDSTKLFGNCLSDSISTFHFVNHPPHFKGDLEDFITSRFDVQKLLLESKSDSKTDSILIKFLVTRNGDLCRFRFLNSPTDYLREAVIKTFLQMPNWEPGTHDGGRLLNVYSQILLVVTTNPNTKSTQTSIYYITNRIL
jgi:hypothetical protein